MKALKTFFFFLLLLLVHGRQPTKFSEWEGKCMLGNNQSNISPAMATAHQAFIILPKFSKNHFESYLRKGNDSYETK